MEEGLLDVVDDGAELVVELGVELVVGDMLVGDGYDDVVGVGDEE